MKTNMAAAMLNVPTLGPPSLPPPSHFSIHDRFCPTSISTTRTATTNSNPSSNKLIRFPIISCCVNSTTAASTISSSSPDEASTPHKELPPPVKKKRRVYRRRCPGEDEGISGEMRFVAMRLRKSNNNVRSNNSDENDDNSEMEVDGSDNIDREIDGPDDDDGGTDNENSGGEDGTWEPSMKGFLKYLVDSKLVFSTIERLVDESQDVSYTYFRNTGLERSESFTKDLEWFSQQDVPIPKPSNPGQDYVKYLEELAEKRPPLFLCHFYNIYFSHIAGGQMIAKQVSERILEGRELEICHWQGDAEELLKGVREKLDALAQHWSRDVRSRCLKEAKKSFRYLGQIIRLIIL